MNLDEFRKQLDDTYTIHLASDSLSMARLTAHIELSDACGIQSTFYRVRGNKVNLKTQSLGEATRTYWTLVYNSGTK
jgi:hypothetical protein